VDLIGRVFAVERVPCFQRAVESFPSSWST
jgi:hypothetical protein